MTFYFPDCGSGNGAVADNHHVGNEMRQVTRRGIQVMGSEEEYLRQLEARMQSLFRLLPVKPTS